MTEGQRPDRSRYPGVRSFQEQDNARFFGRRAATEELLLRVLSVRLLLQFAPSGSGKTSLLQAGLFPQLRPHGYLPVNIRLNEPQETLLQASRRSLMEATREGQLRDPIIPEAAANLWDLLGGAQLWSSQLLLLTPVLVFDQFEEVFTRRDEKFREGFAREIGELTRGRQMAGAADGPAAAAPNVKIIISLREEYLGALEEMTAGIPDLFRERLRLLPLTDPEAREAMIEPARLEGDFASPRFGFEKSCLDGLIDFIDGVSPRIHVIEPLTLQLVCQRAEAIASAKPPVNSGPRLVFDDFGGLPGLENLVSHYYNDVLDKLPDRRTRKNAVEMFERGLLDSSGKRTMLEQDEIARQFKLGAADLNSLVESRLVRREPRNESIFYEISHDRLTDVIAKRRSTPLPKWAITTMAVAAIMIIGLGFALSFILAAQERAKNSERATSHALNVLFGHELTQRLSDASLSGVLEDALEDAPLEQAADALTRARRARLLGELNWERGTLASAEQSFLEALAVLDAADQEGQGKANAELLIERARVLKFLGDVNFDRAEISTAENRYQQSVNVWNTLGNSNLSPMMRLYAIETHMALANAWQRLGETTRPKQEIADAVRQALDILKVTYQASNQSADASFALGRAMQLYGDLMPMIGNSVWSDPEERRISRALATESARLRPLSTWARTQLASASAMYGASVVGPNGAGAGNDLNESRQQFLELTQVDPRNRRMRRERAAAQLLGAEVITSCAEDASCRKKLKADELKRAESSALDAAGRIQELAAEDPDSRSLRYDTAWAKSVQARLDALHGDREMAIQIIDAASSDLRDSIVDPRDNEYAGFAIDLMLIKAQIIGDSGRQEDALKLAGESFDAAGSLPGTEWREFKQNAALLGKERALRALNRPSEADAAAAQAEALIKPLRDQEDARTREGHEFNDAAVELYKRATKATGAAQVQLFDAAADQYRAALTKLPGDAIIWDNLRNACAWAAQLLTDDSGGVLAAGAENFSKAENERRCGLESSWLAWVLSDENGANPANVAERAVRLKQLYVDRRSLAMLLRNDAARVPEALALAEKGVRDAEVLVAQDPSSEARFLLTESYYGLGLMREESGHSGWEQAMRAAIVGGEQLRDNEPRNFERFMWLAQVRSVFSDRLETHHDASFTHERKLALEACQRALKVAGNPAERERAQACVTDAEKSAVAPATS